MSKTDGASDVARCGFRRCREPLPPPGPRGGRPYEFCPDRTWPGGKSCKQLTAAEQALREALGEDAVPTAALREAGEAFGSAAAAVSEPLRALSNALDAITARLQQEVTAAVTRAETAELAVRDAERQRDAALATATEAQEAVRDAAVKVEEAEQAQAVAETAAQEAVHARSVAQLDQARAEAAAAAIGEQAEKSAADAAAQRARADDLAGQLSSRAEELSARTAERDAAQAALQEFQHQAKTLERILTTQKTELTGELENIQGQLRQSEVRTQNLIAEHHTRDTELRTRLGEAHAELAGVGGQLEAVRTQLSESAARHKQLTALLSRVRRRALAAAAEPPTALRDDLLTILLDDTPAAETSEHQD
ncbi:response regulator receiver protein [Amycolatopsis sp. RM579]|uniref:Response regulator receiver protein n=1 Tax=Amycolatopsis pithecellobii TaxID=664692 RepID=A0A6N7Z6C4_9PSEU|nr:response regulator receiver protein [Amycolatopsis pithecellobii]